MIARRTIYLALCISFLGVSSLLAADKQFEFVSDVEYVRRDSGPLRADFYMPKGKGPFPGVIVVHGGAWLVGDKSRMAHVGRQLAQEGFVAMSIQYRLAPRHVFPAQLDDCRAALDFLSREAATYKVDPTRLAGYGYSAGGQLVALLGAMPILDESVTDSAPLPRLCAVVAGGAPCDFRSIPPANTGLAYWLGGTRGDKPESYALASPAQFASADDPPMFFWHGEVDSLVPLTSPQSMVQQLVAAGGQATLYSIPGAGHIAAFRHTGAASEAVKFLHAQLRAPKEKVRAATDSSKRDGGS